MFWFIMALVAIIIVGLFMIGDYFFGEDGPNPIFPREATEDEVREARELCDALMARASIPPDSLEHNGPSSDDTVADIDHDDVTGDSNWQQPPPGFHPGLCYGKPPVNLDEAGQRVKYLSARSRFSRKCTAEVVGMFRLNDSVPAVLALSRKGSEPFYRYANWA